MKKYLTINILLPFCVCLSLQAQSYASLRLQMLGEMLPAKSIPAKDSVYSCLKVLQGKFLTVNYNAKNEINHLGVSLFSNETKALINKPICDFIERIMLDLLLHQKQGLLQNKLDEFHITLDKTGINAQKVKNLALLLNNMNEPVKFSLMQEEKRYIVAWEFADNNGLRMIFPANRELIFGTNKKESDLSLNENLNLRHCTDNLENQQYMADFEIDSINVKTGFYNYAGNYFILKQLNNDILYAKNTTNRFIPVFDKNFPEISLKNLLLNTQLKGSQQIHIKHRMYGRFTPEFTMPLSDFTCFFEKEYTSYCFVERNKDGVLEGTLILHNSRYNYIHLLSVTVSTETLFNGKGVLQGDFTTNIPQDNIKNLF
jgi:hypothetical protein